jgi:hypothetical protein
MCCSNFFAEVLLAISLKLDRRFGRGSEYDGFEFIGLGFRGDDMGYSWRWAGDLVG